MKTFFSSMHPTIRYLSTLLFCLPLIGCKPKETKLSGQIFIVTRGAENIKLGLVGVELIERHNAEEFFQKKHEEINSEILGRERAYAEAKTNNDVAKAKYDEFFSIYSECLEMKDRLEVLLRVFEPSKDQQLEIVQIKEKMNKIASAQQGILLSDTLDVVREKYAKAKTRLEVATIRAIEPYPKVETYFADFAPLVIQKIFTDAEGKFSTSFRHDKAYTVFAKA